MHNTINYENNFVRVYTFTMCRDMKLLTNPYNTLPMEIVSFIQKSVYQMVFKTTTNWKLEEPEINAHMQFQWKKCILIEE